MIVFEVEEISELSMIIHVDRIHPIGLARANDLMHIS